jgi:carboxylesterase type B
MCPQSGVDASSYSEDCLYFVAYVPSNATPVSFSGGAPVLVWIHGGSYIAGSASDPVLDGSKLAEATGSVVVVIQYRLGVLGYLPPPSLSANKNLGVQDVMTALKYIQNAIGHMGGDNSKIVLAAQSSGGNMIRNLLATPSASGLFSRAIIASDPMVRSSFLISHTSLTLALVGLWLLEHVNVHKPPKRILRQRLMWVVLDNTHQ